MDWEPKLETLKGDSKVMRAPTNLGVHVDGKTAVVIDTGLGDDKARALCHILEREDLMPVAIVNTHCHADHCGGNAFISRRTKSEIYAPPLEVCFIEDSELHIRTLFSQAVPPADPSMRLLRAERCRVDRRVTLDETSIAGHNFHVMDLRGHSIGQIGLLSDDKVLYAGDAVFNRSVLEKHPVPFYVDPDETRRSIDRVLSSKAETVVLGHGEPLTMAETRAHASNFRDCIDQTDMQILDLLDQPKTTEEVISTICTQRGLDETLVQLLLAETTIKGHLSSLARKKQLKFWQESHKTYWSR
jgi:glyoxylase-like metal-dependent hydrolase (beta-lactamase superfamily II)